MVTEATGRTSGATRILGLDPGSRFTGVGIIDVDGQGHLQHVFHTTLSVGNEPSFPLRLKRIYDELDAIVLAYAPAECGLERVFVARNPGSALKLGQARGAAICALAGRALPIHEYAATEVKQSVAGSGRADKLQMQRMVGLLLGLAEPLQADAADALGIAVTHAHMRSGLGRLTAGRTRRASRGRRRWR